MAVWNTCITNKNLHVIIAFSETTFVWVYSNEIQSKFLTILLVFMQLSQCHRNWKKSLPESSKSLNRTLSNESRAKRTYRGLTEGRRAASFWTLQKREVSDSIAIPTSDSVQSGDLLGTGISPAAIKQASITCAWEVTAAAIAMKSWSVSSRSPSLVEFTTEPSQEGSWRPKASRSES